MRTNKMKSRQSMHNDDFDYEKEMNIDPDFLDVEFLNHPTLAMKVGKLSAIANKEAKEAEERVKTLRSELVMQANTEPDKYLGKGVKPTAPVVEAYYRTDEDYVEAKTELIEAQYNADMLNHAVFAVQARKTTLENLVRLIGLEYNSTPNEPRDLPEFAEEFEKKKKKLVQNKVKSRLNRK